MAFMKIFGGLLASFMFLTASASLQSGVQPYPSAPLCADSGELHDNNLFHTLWDDVRGCHYDHEHGTNPFTVEVAAVFPDIQLFLGGSQIGHTNPSSPMENTDKHGGFKWDTVIPVPNSCVSDFEGAVYCIKSAAIQYHNFGDYSHEMEHSIHSTAAFLEVCSVSVPTDCGKLYTIQHSEFGQRIVPYQGTVIPYPDTFIPAYASSLGQYFSVDCIDPILPTVPQCRKDINFIVSRGIAANSIWASSPTFTQPGQLRPPGSTILKFLFRVRDTYQVFDWNDFIYPFTFRYLCGDSTYNAVGCRYNNSTSKIHEIRGTIPTSWDNLEGFDINPLPGRITAQGFTDRFGTLTQSCLIAGGDCFPIKLVDMFTGTYADYLTATKVSGTSPTSNPERDICFNGSGVQVGCDVTGAIPSGWIGSEN